MAGWYLAQLVDASLHAVTLRPFYVTNAKAYRPEDFTVIASRAYANALKEGGSD